MFPKPFAKHNNSLKYYQCSCGINRSNQENDQRIFLSRLKTEGRDQSSSSKLIDKDVNFKDAFDKKHSTRSRNKQNQQGNNPLISQLQRQHSNHKPNFNCAVKNEYNLKNSSELISRRRWNLNYTPIGKIQDIFQEIVEKEQKPIRCQKYTMPSMANVRERCMAPKESKPKISINYVKRKATANYDSKSPEIKTLKSRSHSTANITSKRAEPQIVSHPSFNNMQPVIRKLSRPGLGDLCFKPTESIVADDSDLISEVLSSRSIESRLLEVDSEWGSTLDELFKRRHRKDPLD